MASSPLRKILLFTNSDYGQANVVLATAYELLLSAPDVEVHIASFQGIHAAVQDTVRLAEKNAGGKPLARLEFHRLDGTTQFDAVGGPEVDIFEAWDRPVTFMNAAHCILKIDGIMQPWTPDEFASLYTQSAAIYNKVKPDLTAVEPLFTPAATLCNHVKANWIVLAPNTMKDFAIMLQPRLAALWKYPIVCSALPFPLPKSLIPANIAYNFVAAYMLLTSKRVKNATDRLREVTGEDISLFTASEMGVMKAPPPGLRILVANTPELDYHFEVLPSHVISCGPIIRASPTIDSTDSSLKIWLARGPTVYVNLGSHLEVDEAEALEMAVAFRTLLDKADTMGKNLQILWKAKAKEVQPNGETEAVKVHVQEDIFNAIHKTLGQDEAKDRIRLTTWFKAEPKSILESGHVICSVNHGGAGAFNEALCAGVPQVVLPGWADCYDFANRAELLGIGRWANKQAKPRWRRDELAAALVDVVLGPSSGEIRSRATELSGKYPEDAGRKMAAAALLDALATTAQ